MTAVMKPLRAKRRSPDPYGPECVVLRLGFLCGDDNGRPSHSGTNAVQLYQPELDLTVCAWFERSGFVSEVIRLRSFSPSSSAWHRGRSASGFCRSTSVPDGAAPHYIL